MKKIEEKFRRDQHKKFSDSLKVSKKIVPLFMGIDGNDFRGDNLFQSLGDTG